jgi:hypothetical protein
MAVVDSMWYEGPSTFTRRAAIRLEASSYLALIGQPLEDSNTAHTGPPSWRHNTAGSRGHAHSRIEAALDDAAMEKLHLTRFTFSTAFLMRS